MPFQARRAPRVGRCLLPEEERERKIKRGQQVAEAQDAGARRGHNVVNLELSGVVRVPPRHPVIPDDELRNERQEEPDDDDARGHAAPPIGVHPARHLGPPEVETREVTQHHAANHHEVEVRDHEVGIVQVNVRSQCGQE